MSPRLPWALLGLWAVLTAVSAALYAAQGEVLDALISPALAVFAVVGALLAARRPDNPIGWLLLAVALLIALSGVVAGAYGHAESDPDPELLTRLLVWFDSWVLYLWLGLIALVVPLLFPSGRLSSRRWRAFLLGSAGTVGAAILGTAFGSPTLEWGTDGAIANPLRIPGPAGDALEALEALGGPAFSVAFLAVLCALVLRLHRSTGIERQQLKWFAVAMALLLIGLVGAALGDLAGLEAVGNAGWSLFLCSLIAGLPLAIGIAIMRYRLYDIDVVIHRAIVYGALTLTLAATYLGLVLVVGLAVGESDLAIAASTLAVAALFRPARLRIQAQVDRRFYRRRYDGARTLERFAMRLRDELDLETLGAELRAVVSETMQPAHVSLWLRRTR